MTAGRQTYENRTMAKYDVDYSCGHSGVVNLGGKSGYRERMVEWYERKGLCPECLQAKKEKDKEAAYKAQLARAEAMGLPELTGTPKQVIWAVDIRNQIKPDGLEFIGPDMPLLQNGKIILLDENMQETDKLDHGHIGYIKSEAPLEDGWIIRKLSENPIVG